MNDKIKSNSKWNTLASLYKARYYVIGSYVMSLFCIFLQVYKGNEFHGRPPITFIGWMLDSSLVDVLMIGLLFLVVFIQLIYWTIVLLNCNNILGKDNLFMIVSDVFRVMLLILVGLIVGGIENISIIIILLLIAFQIAVQLNMLVNKEESLKKSLTISFRQLVLFISILMYAVMIPVGYIIGTLGSFSEINDIFEISLLMITVVNPIVFPIVGILIMIFFRARLESRKFSTILVLIPVALSTIITIPVFVFGVGGKTIFVWLLLIYWIPVFLMNWDLIVEKFKK